MSFDNIEQYSSTSDIDRKFDFLQQQIGELRQIQNMITFTPRGLVIARPLSTLFVGEKIDKTKAKIIISWGFIVTLDE
jgi:hypothetical protein